MLLCVVQRVLTIVDIAQTVAPVCAICVIMVSDLLQQISAKVRQFLIHDLLFLPISTIESRVCYHVVTHSRGLFSVHACVDTSSQAWMNQICMDVAANLLTQTVSIESVHKLQLQRSWIKLVRPLSTVDSTRDYARVSHSRQWSNYNYIFILHFTTTSDGQTHSHILLSVNALVIVIFNCCLCSVSCPVKLAKFGGFHQRWKNLGFLKKFLRF